MPQSALKNQSQAYNLDMRSVFQFLLNNPPIQIEQFVCCGKTFKFNEPYRLTVKIDDDAIWHENKELDIIVSGRTVDELLQDFFEFTHATWEGLVNTDDKLSKSAEELKGRLMAAMLEVK